MSSIWAFSRMHTGFMKKSTHTGGTKVFDMQAGRWTCRTGVRRSRVFVNSADFAGVLRYLENLLERTARPELSLMH